MRAPNDVDQPPDQLDVPGQPGLGRESDRDRSGSGFAAVARTIDLDISEETVVRHAFIVEWRQHQRAGEAELGGMPRQRDGVGDRGRAGADHEPIERQPRLAVSAHHALALLERERGGLAGGAEHVQSVAAIGEQKARERGRTRAIRLALVVDGGRDGGDHALQFAGGHLAPPGPGAAADRKARSALCPRFIR